MSQKPRSPTPLLMGGGQPGGAGSLDWPQSQGEPAPAQAGSRAPPSWRLASPWTNLRKAKGLLGPRWKPMWAAEPKGALRHSRLATAWVRTPRLRPSRPVQMAARGPGGPTHARLGRRAHLKPYDIPGGHSAPKGGPAPCRCAPVGPEELGPSVRRAVPRLKWEFSGGRSRPHRESGAARSPAFGGALGTQCGINAPTYS